MKKFLRRSLRNGPRLRRICTRLRCRWNCLWCSGGMRLPCRIRPCSRSGLACRNGRMCRCRNGSLPGARKTRTNPCRACARSRRYGVRYHQSLDLNYLKEQSKQYKKIKRKENKRKETNLHNINEIINDFYELFILIIFNYNLIKFFCLGFYYIFY